MPLSPETENLITFYTDQNESLQKQLDQLESVENGITITTGIDTTGQLIQTKIWGANEVLDNYSVPISNIDDQIVTINDEITSLRQQIITTYNTAVAYGCSHVGGPGIGSTATLYAEKVKYKGYKYSGSNPFKNVGGTLKSSTTVGINSENAVGIITTSNGGSISYINLLESDTGYKVTPQITIAPPVGVGSTATAVATIVDGSIDAITITGIGSGYTGLSTTVFIENPGRTTGLGTMSFVLDILDDESPVIIGDYYPLTGACTLLFFPGCENGECADYVLQITNLETQISQKIQTRTCLLQKVNKLKSNRIEHELQQYGYKRTKKQLKEKIDKNKEIIDDLSNEQECYP